MTIRPPLRQFVASTVLATIFLASCGGDKPEAMLASARDYLAKNDRKAAIIQIKNALQGNPNLPEARYLLGKALLESGDAVAAEVELRKAIELKVSADQVTPLLAKALLAQGQFKKLTGDLAKAELTSPEAKADLQTALATAHLYQGKLADAEAALVAALAARPGYAPAIITQARIKAGSRDFAGSLAQIQSVLGQSPNNHDAWKLKGDILRAQNENEPALDAYRKAVDANPESAGAHTAVVTTLIQLGKLEDAGKQLEAMKKSVPKHPQTAYVEAQLAYQKKDFKAAREFIQQLLKSAPNHPTGLELAGAVEYQLNSFVQAEALLAKALQIAPDLPLARRLLCVTYLRTGQPAKALSVLQPILDKIDGDPNLLALAGEVFVQNGEIEKAESYFSKASSLDPKDAAKRTSLALTRVVKGDVDAAFGELEAISASDAGTTADMALIAAHLRRNEFDQALKAIDRLEKKDPGNPVAHNIRGRTLLARKDVAGARKSFERALAIRPAYFPAAASLAALDLQDKKPIDATKRFEAVLAVDAGNVQALLALAQLRGSGGGKPDEVAVLVAKAITANPTDPAPRVALVNLYLNNKDFKKAVAAAQDAIAAIPDRPELLEGLGRAQQAGGDVNQALATYGKLAGLLPTSPQPHMRMAEIHFAAKNREAALQSLRKSLEIKPDLLEAQRVLIALSIDSGRIQDAIAVARDVQKQRPKEATGYLLEGDIQVAGKSWGLAADAYRSGLKKVAAPELAIKLHLALKSGGGGDAEKFAASWLKEHPKDVAFRFHLGDTATVRKDFTGAAQAYRSILELQPNNAVALNNLAWVTGQTNSPKAIEYAEQALKIDPGQPAFMDTLAMLLLDKGETARALELFKKALATAPEAASIRLNFAKALIKSGDKAAAKKELQELAKLGDKFGGQALVTQMIKDL